MNTAVPLLILTLGRLLHLTLSQCCNITITLASHEKKTIRTTDTVYEDEFMRIKVDKLHPCKDFHTVILQVEEANGTVHEASFPAEGKCWDKKTEWKKLEGEVYHFDNHLYYILTVDECKLEEKEESKEFEFRRFTVVGHGQSHWCIGVKDPPMHGKPLPLKCCTPASLCPAEVVPVVGWVVGGIVAVAAVVVTVVVAVMRCVCRRTPPPSREYSDVFY